MKLVKKIISKLPFVTFSMKVDPAVKEIISIKRIKHIPLIVVFKIEPDSILISRLKRLGFKIKYTIPFANAVCGKLPVRNFDNLVNIIEVIKIYYDSKVTLMGSKKIVSKKVTPKLELKNCGHLSGKDVTVAFIDSGIYPHPDFINPRNRIIDFKDFVNHMDFPYDDNGHGTACIGAGFAASVDGKFKAAAYNSNIVCAKAFDKFSTAFYSDILASMQWILDIREQHNIKILVLPFGTSRFSKNFDLLSSSCKKLWDKGLFLCTCAGNFGPYQGTITSPGVCTHSFTVGACTLEGFPLKVVDFSGRGPVFNSMDKPDAVMPGTNITTLNADITYSPQNKMYYDYKKHMTLYREISGTSVSASLCASITALIYQINPAFSPDDIKSILKTCSTSLNELKYSQGAGIIQIKRLEEL